MNYRRKMDLGLRARGWDPDESRRKSHLDRKFGAGSYDKIVAWRESQNCTCKICGRPEEVRYEGVVKHLMADHCHRTNRLRGLICTRCNHALGHFKDSPELLRKAARYLRERSPER